MKHLFFTLFSLMVCTMLRAYDAEIDGIYYSFSGNKATVTYRDEWYDSYKGDLIIPESVSYNGKTYSVTSIGDLAISNCTSLNSITIPNSVTTIEKRAFYHCPSLTTINIPGSVKSIGNSAFYHCTNLTSVTLSEGLTLIGCNAFLECSALTSITIPNSVTRIEGSAFYNCSNLSSIVCNAKKPPYVGEFGFSGVDKQNCKLYVPQGCEEAYRTAEEWKDFGNIVALPDEYYPEGTKWTEIRLDTLKYNSWYSKVGDEWVPNFETIEYYVKGECNGGYRDYYKLVYTNGPEWSDSLTLLISESQYGIEVSVAVFDENVASFPPGLAYGFGNWKVGTTLSYQTIDGANTPSLPPAGIREFGTITEIKEAYFGGVCPLKYVDLNGTRLINGIGVTEWNDGECIFGPVDPYFCYYAMSSDLPQERNYRSMLVHFERNGEVLYNVWPGTPDDMITFTEGQMATIILPITPDASKGKYYRLDRCEENKIIFEEELTPKAHVPYIIMPNQDFTIDLSTMDLEGCLRDTVSIKGITFIGSYVSEKLNEPEGFYIDIIDLTPDCGLSPSGGTGTFLIGALRAYLQVSKTWDDPYHPGGTKGITGKLEIVLHDNGTGFAEMKNDRVKSEKYDNAIYDLQGRKIANGQQPTAKGLYIMNGKKVVK